jgi:HEPN domain-containing protein
MEGLGVNRANLRWLAVERLRDARALLATGRWAGAYYLAGYAVECGLKSCILARVTAAPEVIFAERRFSDQCWTHNLEQLLHVAGLKPQFDLHTATDPELLGNWRVATDWSEASRYDRTSRARAEELYQAIADKKHGVMKWIKGHW